MKKKDSSEDFETRVIESFSKRAENYDKYAQIQKTMAERLASLLPDPLPSRVLELGCGTGLFTRHLLTRPVDFLVLNDIAPGMIDHIRSHLTLPASAQLRVGNAERLRFDPVHLIAGNAVVQWFRQPAATFRHLKGSLEPGGRLVFSTFGPETLREFRQTGALESPATLHSQKEWETLLGKTGFTVREAQREVRKTFFPNTQTLIRSLQQIGAAPLKMVSTGTLRGLIRKYDETFQTPQGVYASWELLYFSASL